MTDMAGRTIRIEDILCIVERILNRIVERRGVEELILPEFGHDFYWDFAHRDLYIDRSKETVQPEPVIGSLCDDWGFIQSILKDPEVAVSYQMIHVAPLLRWIGHVIRQ